MEFARFGTEWDFRHTTSSPRYPQSNGLEEKFVQTTKRLIDKAQRHIRKTQEQTLLEADIPIEQPERERENDTLGSQPDIVEVRTPTEQDISTSVEHTGSGNSPHWVPLLPTVEPRFNEPL